MLTSNFQTDSSNSTYEVIMPTMIELIDDYIAMNVEYDDAYLYAIEDLERALAAERQAEDDELFVKQAMKRGYGEQEARVLVSQARKLTAQGEYAKAYRLYLSRLMG
jgi:hypothetical protein